MEEAYEQYTSLYGEEQRRSEEVKAARKQFSGIGCMFFFGTLIIYAVQLSVVALVQVLRPEWLANADIALTVSMVPMYLIGMPLLILLVKRVPAGQPRRRPMKAGHFVLAAMMCIALAYVANIIGLILTTVIGMLKGGLVGNPIVSVMEPTSSWVLFLYVVICAPIIEEYVFRKLIVDRTIRYGQGAAVIVSGLMFGLFHGNLNQFTYAFAIGVFLAFLYAKTGNLKVTIGIHMFINFTSGFVTALLVKKIDLGGYMAAATDGDMGVMMAYMQENAAGLILYGLYLLFVIGIGIAGVVLLIVSLVQRKFVFEKGEVVIPKGKRFRTVILNVGMALYGIFWIAMIVWQLLG